MFLGKKSRPEIQKVDVRNYVKFVLKEGSVLEKRMILECVAGEINLKDRAIRMQ
jgi:hypothetical protein